jgi:hypothetical protein
MDLDFMNLINSSHGFTWMDFDFLYKLRKLISWFLNLHKGQYSQLWSVLFVLKYIMTSFAFTGQG